MNRKALVQINLGKAASATQFYWMCLELDTIWNGIHWREWAQVSLLICDFFRLSLIEFLCKFLFLWNFASLLYSYLLNSNTVSDGWHGNRQQNRRTKLCSQCQLSAEPRLLLTIELIVFHLCLFPSCHLIRNCYCKSISVECDEVNHIISTLLKWNTHHVLKIDI